MVPRKRAMASSAQVASAVGERAVPTLEQRLLELQIQAAVAVAVDIMQPMSAGGRVVQAWSLYATNFNQEEEARNGTIY